MYVKHVKLSACPACRPRARTQPLYVAASFPLMLWKQSACLAIYDIRWDRAELRIMSKVK